MRGKLIIFDANKPVPRIVEYDHEPIKLNELNSAVGGYIEVVPYFDTLLLDGKRQRCVVFCNEQGKLEGLPMNPLAQALWHDALAYQRMGQIDDYLVGSIAIAVGDEQFLAEL